MSPGRRKFTDAADKASPLAGSAGRALVSSPVELVHVGFGNLVALNRVLAIMAPDSAPVKRMVQEARQQGALLDVTCGRKTQAVIALDTGGLVLAAIQPETIAARVDQRRELSTDGIG